MNIIVPTTTSTLDSGLLDVLLPMFERETGFKVELRAVGSGKALTMGENGQADALLVHSPNAEKRLLESDVVVNYHRLMHNDFVLVGPQKDPAGVRALTEPAKAFSKIALSQSAFVSRADESGTHVKESEIWNTSGIEPFGAWYMKTGTGMADTLRTASSSAAYTLTDRATFCTNKPALQLEILVEGHQSLLNVYHVMQVNPERFPATNKEGAEAFVRFMMSEPAQKRIGEFEDSDGNRLFTPAKAYVH